MNEEMVKPVVDGLTCSVGNLHEDRSTFFCPQYMWRAIEYWEKGHTFSSKKHFMQAEGFFSCCCFSLSNKMNTWLKSICCFPGKQKTEVSTALWSAAQIIFREPWGKQDAHGNDSKNSLLGGSTTSNSGEIQSLHPCNRSTGSRNLRKIKHRSPAMALLEVE